MQHKTLRYPSRGKYSGVRLEGLLVDKHRLELVTSENIFAKVGTLRLSAEICLSDRHVSAPFHWPPQHMHQNPITLSPSARRLKARELRIPDGNPKRGE